MTRSSPLLHLPFLLVSILPTLANTKTTSSFASWSNSHETKNNETITTLRFYFHEIFDGKDDSTAVWVAKANSTTDNSPTFFGLVIMADAPLTEKPSLASKQVGRAAQGMYAAASTREIALLMALTFKFTQGIYNGSSFSILGRNPIMHTTREMPVVGGTGLFRWACGYAVAHTYKFDKAAGVAIVGYNVTLAVAHALKNI